MVAKTGSAKYINTFLVEVNPPVVGEHIANGTAEYGIAAQLLGRAISVQSNPIQMPLLTLLVIDRSVRRLYD